MPGTRHAAARNRVPIPMLALFLATGCYTDDVLVTVQLDHPVAVEGMAFPYDPLALFDSLPDDFPPRPVFPELEAAMRSFSMPRTDLVDSLSLEWEATRDSVRNASDRLFTMDRETEAYRNEYGVFQRLYSRLTSRASARQRAMRQLLGSQTDLANRAELAADSLRLWEDSAFAELGDAVLRIALHREKLPFVFDGDGTATVTLPPGDWWIVVRGRHPENPFLEHLWSQPVRISGLRKNYRVPLSARNRVIRWRY